MSIPSTFLNVWERSIRERLINEIGQFFRNEICQPELLMVSDSSGKIGPCIVVSVWDESQCDSEDGKTKTVRKAKKRLRKFQSMHNCVFPFKVIADKISLASHSLNSCKTPVSADSTALSIRETLVSLQLNIETHAQQRQFRLGGLIQSEGKIYGLTVAHPFHPATQPSSISLQSEETGSDTDSKEDDGGSDSEGTLFGSNHYTILPSTTTESDDQAVVRWHDNSLAYEPRATSRVPLFHASLTDSSVISFGQLAFMSDGSPGSYGVSDWALIELDNSIPILPNSYIPAHAQRSILINAVHHDEILPKTDVFILAGPDRQIHGIIGQSNVMLTIDGLDLIVTQIMVAEPLGPGYSGSWIVRDNLFVGCVVAVRRCLPVVYAILANSVMNDIAQCIGNPDTGTANLDLTSFEKQRKLSASSSRNTQADKISINDVNDTDRRQFNQRSNLPLYIPQEQHAEGSPRVAIDPDAILVVAGEEVKKSKLKNYKQIAEEPIDEVSSSGGNDENQFSVSTNPKPDLSSEAAPMPGFTDKETSSLMEKPTQLVRTVAPGQDKEDLEDGEYRVTLHDIWSGDRRPKYDQVDYERFLRSLNPKDWSQRRFWIMWAMVTYQSFLTSYAHSMLGPGLTKIRLELEIKNEIKAQMVYSVFSLGSIIPSAIAIPLSKKYGRMLMLRISLIIFIAFNVACGFAKSASTLILFRFLSSVGGSVPLVIGGSVIIDMTRLSRSARVSPINLYHIVWAGHLCIGPLASAWIEYQIGWRWIFWTISIAAFILLPALLVLGRETHTPCIQNSSEEQVRKQTGNQLIYPQGQRGNQESSLMKSFSASINLIRLMATSPMVILIAISKSVSSGTMDFVQTTLGAVLASRYDLNLKRISYCYLILGFGFLVGGVLSIAAPSLAGKARRKNSRGRDESEYKLLASVFSFFVSSVGLITYASLIQTKSSLTGVAVALIIFGVGAFNSTIFATWDGGSMYPVHKTLAIGWINVPSSICKFAFPLFAPAFQRRINFVKSHTILAILSLLLGWTACILLWVKVVKPSQLERRELLNSSNRIDVSVEESAEKDDAEADAPTDSNR